MYQIFIKLFHLILNYLYRYYPDVYSKFYFTCKSIFEVNNARFLKKWIKDGDLCIDVGANIGFYTSFILSLKRKFLKIYSFEPDIENFKILKKNVRSNKHVNLYSYAVGFKKNFVYLYKSSIHNTDHHTFDIGEKRDFEKVKCVTLDSFIPNGKQVNLIKIDVQGYDYFVLLGAKKIISRSKRVAVLGEIWPYALNKSGIKPSKYLNLIKNMGLKFVANKLSKIDLDKNINNPRFYIDFIAVKS